MNYETILTKQDYLYFEGIDLSTELTTMVYNDVGDDAAPRFIFNVETWCKNYLIHNYAFDGTPKTNHQILQWKLGVAAQIKYVLLNGEIRNDLSRLSQLISIDNINKLGIAADALLYFRTGGMANMRRS